MGARETISPELDFAAEPLDKDTAFRNVQEHIRVTEFQAGVKPILMLAEQPTDPNGAYRREEKGLQKDGDHIDLNCVFEERFVKQGENICAVGRFAAEGFGLAPEPQWSQPTRIMKGDPAGVQRKLRKRIISYVVAGLVFCAIGTAIAFWFSSTLS